MTDLRQAAQQALEAWDSTVLPVANDGMMQERMEILRETLEQPEQHPVAFVNADHLQGLTLGHYGYAEIYTDESEGRVPLYTTPPAAQPAPVPCCGKYETCTQACTPRGKFLGARAIEKDRAVQLAHLPFFRQVVAAAIAGLYYYEKEYVVRAFDPTTLQDVLETCEPLSDQRVEDIYKRAWGILSTSPATQQEPFYHFRQYGDVTKEQLDRYMATGDINPTPTAAQRSKGDKHD